MAESVRVQERTRSRSAHARVSNASLEGTRRAKAVHNRKPFPRIDMTMRRTRTVRRTLVQRSPN
jgi:hypothetical protein